MMCLRSFQYWSSAVASPLADVDDDSIFGDDGQDLVKVLLLHRYAPSIGRKVT